MVNQTRLFTEVGLEGPATVTTKHGWDGRRVRSAVKPTGAVQRPTALPLPIHVAMDRITNRRLERYASALAADIPAHSDAA